MSGLLSNIREHIHYACLFYNESAKTNKFYNEVHMSANAYKTYINDNFRLIVEKILDNQESAYLYKEQFTKSLTKLQTLSKKLPRDTIDKLEVNIKRMGSLDFAKNAETNAVGDNVRSILVVYEYCKDIENYTSRAQEAYQSISSIIEEFSATAKSLVDVAQKLKIEVSKFKF